MMFSLEPTSGEPHGDDNEITGAGYFSLDEIEAKDRVRGLSRFAIQRAISELPCFAPAQAGTDPNRTGRILLGLKV